MNDALARHLAAHCGLVSTEQFVALGASKDVLARMVRNGDLVRVLRGVYRHSAVPITFEQRLRAGLLATGAGSVVSHRAGLAWYEVPNFACALVELSTRSTSLPLRAGMVVHRSRTLTSADVRRHKGVDITTPARTIVDAASVMSPLIVARYAEQMMANRQLRPDDLAATLRRSTGRPGARELAEHLRDAIPDSDSVPESRLGQILIRAGLPPVLHFLVTTDLGETYELDWSYPEARVGLELDGYGVHLRSTVAFDDDRFRRNELGLTGWQILNFTSRMVRLRPDVVIGQVRRALALSSSAA